MFFGWACDLYFFILYPAGRQLLSFVNPTGRGASGAAGTAALEEIPSGGGTCGGRYGVAAGWCQGLGVGAKRFSFRGWKETCSKLGHLLGFDMSCSQCFGCFFFFLTGFEIFLLRSSQWVEFRPSTPTPPLFGEIFAHHVELHRSYCWMVSILIGQKIIRKLLWNPQICYTTKYDSDLGSGWHVSRNVQRSTWQYIALCLCWPLSDSNRQANL